MKISNGRWSSAVLRTISKNGQANADRIEKIAIDYRRVTKIKPKEPFNADIEYVTWDYSEHLTIERESETLEHIRNVGTGCKISRKYQVEDGVTAFLDDHYSSDFLSRIKGNSPDAIDDPMETKDYTITIDMLYGGQRVISGSFDKNGLPEDFPDLAEEIMNFMCFYGMGEILNPSVYGKAKRNNSDYIFCSVEFEKGGKSYYYLTDDDTLKIGDTVLVPTGKVNRTAIVEIINIEYFSEDNTPFPLAKVKRIIRKCTYDDFDTPENKRTSIKIPDDVVIMSREPLKDISPEEWRKMLSIDNSEARLADALAGAWNQSGWLMHDLDDDDCTSEMELKSEAWNALEKELIEKVIKILEKDNAEGRGPFVTSNAPFLEVVLPFMERNGYRNGNGWWVKREQVLRTLFDT